MTAVRRTGNWCLLERQLAETLKRGRNNSVCLAPIISENRDTHQRDLATRIGIELGVWISAIRFYMRD